MFGGSRSSRWSERGPRRKTDLAPSPTRFSRTRQTLPGQRIPLRGRLSVHETCCGRSPSSRRGGVRLAPPPSFQAGCPRKVLQRTHRMPRVAARGCRDGWAPANERESVHAPQPVAGDSKALDELVSDFEGIVSRDSGEDPPRPTGLLGETGSIVLHKGRDNRREPPSPRKDGPGARPIPPGSDAADQAFRWWRSRGPGRRRVDPSRSRDREGRQPYDGCARCSYGAPPPPPSRQSHGGGGGGGGALASEMSAMTCADSAGFGHANKGIQSSSRPSYGGGTSSASSSLHAPSYPGYQPTAGHAPTWRDLDHDLCATVVAAFGLGGGYDEGGPARRKIGLTLINRSSTRGSSR